MAVKKKKKLKKVTKSALAKKIVKGKDVGRKGKNFDKIAEKAGGGEKGRRIAAAAMWKNLTKKTKKKKTTKKKTSRKK